MDKTHLGSRINTPPSNAAFEGKSSEGSQKNIPYIATLSIIVVTILLTITSLFVNMLKKDESTDQSASLKTWLNCNDVRDVIEDSNRLYVACLGGVLVVNKDTGEILNEINIEDGLLSDTTTDLLLANNNLYIGSQGGLDVYNLQTNEHTQISTRSGLPSNHNIKLAYDNESIWIGTYGGLARLNVDSGNVDIFSNELPVDNSRVNVQNLLVTDRAVYMHANSNAYTRGYIARYDKDSKTWSDWGGRDLYNTFLYGLAEFEGEIYVYTSDTVFVASDEVGSKLVKSTKIVDKLNNINTLDKFYRYLGSHGEYSFIFKQNSVYRYNLKTKEITKLITNVDFGQNGPIVNKIIYTFPLDRKKPWLVMYDTITGLEKTISINRPSNFFGVHGSINSEVFVSTNKGLYLIDFSSKDISFTLQNLVTALNNTEYGLQIIQIPNSNKLGIFSQSCEMTCDKPQFIIYDHFERTTKSDNPPSDITSKDRTPYDENMMLSYAGVDDRGKLIFNNDSQNFDVKWLSYSPSSGWGPEKILPNIVIKYEKQDCPPSFQYDLQQKTVNSQASDCSVEQLSLPFLEGVKSLLRLQDKYIGVYTWGGLFSYMP